MNNSDIFLVNRGDVSHKVRFDKLKGDVTGEISQDITELKDADSDLNLKIDTVQLDVNQNERDSDIADVALGRRIDALALEVENIDPTQGNTAIYSRINQLQADVDSNESDSKAADTALSNRINAVQADVNKNEIDSDAADTALSNRIDVLQAEVNQNEIDIEQLESIVVNPLQFGAKADGVTDDSDAINAAIDYAATAKKTYPPTENGIVYKGGRVDGGGLVYGIGKPIDFRDGGLTFENATLVALDGFKTMDVNMPDLDGVPQPAITTKSMIVAGGGNQVLENITLECRFEANGYHRIKNGFWSVCKGVVIRKFKNRGFNIEATSQSGQWFIDCQVDQSSDQNLRTGISFHLKVSDAKLMNCTIRHSYIPLQIEANNTLIDSCHIYNGLDGDDTLGETRNQMIIYQTNIKGIDPYNSDTFYKESGGNSISNCYLGKGRIVLEYPCNFHMTGNRNAFNAGSLDSAILLIAKPFPTLNASGNLVYETGPWDFPEKLVISGYHYQRRIAENNMNFFALQEEGDTWSDTAKSIVNRISSNNTWVHSNVGSSLYGSTLLTSEVDTKFNIQHPTFEYEFTDTAFKTGQSYTGTLTLGNSNSRWKKLFVSEGVNEPASIELRSETSSISDAESRLGKTIKNLVKRYRLQDGGSYKVGVAAEELISAFQAEGLDVFDYNILDYSDGVYGINYTQLLCFIIGGLD